MIFVDTGALFASFVPNDPDHVAARAWIANNTQALVTTDYVLDELFTLLKIRGEFERALRIGPGLMNEEAIALEWVTRPDFRDAWSVFDQYRDKAWSFTDCVSFVVMRRLSIETAFAFDQHFRQFATVSVVP